MGRLTVSVIEPLTTVQKRTASFRPKCFLGEETAGVTMEYVSATAAIYESLRGTSAIARSFSGTTLLDRDFNWCAETMMRKYGLGAPSRAEHRAREMLLGGNFGGRDIWARVAATIRQAQTEPT